MAQAQIFGTFIFNEDDHGWALDLGSDLARWKITTITCRPGPNEEMERILHDDQQAVDRVLVAQRIGYRIPTENLVSSSTRDFSTELTDIYTKVMDTIRVVKSPAHFAFALIGSMSWLLGYMDSETVQRIMPHLRFHLLSMAGSDMRQLQKNCVDRFPLGLDEEALITTIRRARGSKSTLRTILLSAQKPIVILLVLADPRNEKRLALLDEMQRLTESLAATAYRDCFQLQVLASARPDNFAISLSRYKPTIVHFSGHGGSNGILFTNSNGDSVEVLPDRLARILNLARRDGMKAVVMNACYTAEQAEVISSAVQDVIVMDGVLNDDAAIQFSANFYAQLGNGRSFKHAFEWARDADLTGMAHFNPHLISREEEWPTTGISIREH